MSAGNKLLYLSRADVEACDVGVKEVIEAVENACASGGQAVLSTIGKLQMGLGDVGLAVGFEKMRNDEGKMDGALIGEVLGYFSHPDEREGKVFVFPHLFAEVMKLYMETHGVTEEDLAKIAVAEYGGTTKPSRTTAPAATSAPAPISARR